MDKTLQRIVELIGEKWGASKELAEYLGIHPNVITNWKNGRNKSYKRHLPEIATFFNTTVDYLKNGSEDKKIPASSETELKGVYFNFAKEAQESGIDPDDIKLAIETIKKLRGEK